MPSEFPLNFLFSSEESSKPGAERAAVGADVVEGRLDAVIVLLPLPFVDDELPLEVGQELEVLLLLGHPHHLNSKKSHVSSNLKRDEGQQFEPQ